MTNAPNQRFEIQLTPMSNSDDGGRYILRVRDRDSGILVMEAPFTAEQFTNLMSGRVTAEGIPTWFLPVESRQYVGMHRASVSRRFSFSEAVDERTLAKWAGDVAQFTFPCQTVDGPRRKGGDGGYEVSFVSRFASEERAEAWATKSQALLDDLPSPGKIAQPEA